MANEQNFTYYDANGNRTRPPANAPIKLTEYRFRAAEWAGQGLVDGLDPDAQRLTTRTASGEILATSNRWRSNAFGAGTILRVREGVCFECGRRTRDDHPACGAQCYRAWREKTTIDRLVRIRHTGETMGYGAFLGPRGNLQAHRTIGEYLGDIRPDELPGNRYVYSFPNRIAVDAEHAGNWTRFMNSHCDPNVIANTRVVGKRQLIMYQTLRAVAANEQLTCNYGPQYFQSLGIQCRCDAYLGPHVPDDISAYEFVGAAPTRGGARRRAARKGAAKGAAKGPAGKSSAVKSSAVKSSAVKSATAKTAVATKAASKQAVVTQTRSGRIVRPVPRYL